ncbi:Cltc, partial [Symbiodinium necroappetens]
MDTPKPSQPGRRQYGRDKEISEPDAKSWAFHLRLKRFTWPHLTLRSHWRDVLVCLAQMTLSLEELFQRQFNQLFASGDYKGAALIAAQCKSGLLRTPQTIQLRRGSRDAQASYGCVEY